MKNQNNDIAQNVKEKLEQLLNSMALGNAKNFVNSHTKRSIELTPEQIRSMNAEDLFEAAFVLRQYATKINLDFNKYNVIVDWCNAEIDSQIMEEDLSDIFQYELKVATVIKKNSYAKQVNNVKRYNMAYREQLRNISKDVTNMANTLENFARWRKYNG